MGNKQVAQDPVRIANALPPKEYYLLDGIGKVKYTVNFFDGIQKHKDGSNFYGIKCFSNKKKRNAFVKSLKIAGYKER